MSDTVLIVDDSLTVRMDLVEAFESAGFNVLSCASIGEARATLARGPVDVIVLDVLLPDGDGVDLLREIRNSPSSATTAVLMLSSEADVKDRIRGLQTGADEYVGKPYDAGYVVAKARQFLRNGRGQAQTDRQTILIVDDSVTFREEMRHAFEGAGYTVAMASSGEEGLAAAAVLRPNAIVVDGVLPGMDGATVIRRVRMDAALRRIPCVLLTGSEDLGAELRALDAGADAFVRKGEDTDIILAKLAAALRGAAAAEAGFTPSLASPKRILAIDDSLTYLHELGLMLRGDDYDVVLARSGEEALDLLTVQPVDCILLDIQMPGLGGQETCRRIKSSPSLRDIPLIMLTAMDSRAAMLEGLGSGADDYIQKSSEFEVLKARIRTQIRRQQSESENRRIREDLLRRELEAAKAHAAQELAETRAIMVQELKKKNEELEAFSYSVSHDLRSPLRAIGGYSLILEEDYLDRLDDEGRRVLSEIRLNCSMMGSLIDDLLAFSRLGRQPINTTTLDMAGLVNEVWAQIAPPDEVVFRMAALPEAEGDRALIRQVWTNLLSNAVKYSGGKGGPLVEVSGRLEGTEAIFEVRDNGAGFDMRYAKRLFGVFQRLHGSDEFPGTGVGLAIVKNIIVRHGGRVWAEGQIDHGATFHFSLPQAAPGSSERNDDTDEL
ncbi:MAG: multi-sensor signal transduction histidine kinase [Betaproteobacteria bacterium]|nr:multi-sensor signal transduction histidine kinase [Betaproteobacteria bacterium]